MSMLMMALVLLIVVSQHGSAQSTEALRTGKGLVATGIRQPDQSKLIRRIAMGSCGY